MNRATRLTVSTLGVLAALAGIEHGIGEVLQGSQAPAGLTIESWPDAESFRILGGEPALTVVPNLLVTGLLAIFASLVFLVWVTMFIERKNGGLVLMLWSIVLLLVGGGFGPPVLGIIVGAAGTRINAPLSWWRAHLSDGARGLLAKLWPWSFGVSLTAWLLLFPGTIIFAYLFGTDDTSPVTTAVVAALPLVAFGTLLMTIVAGFARDAAGGLAALTGRERVAARRRRTAGHA